MAKPSSERVMKSRAENLERIALTVHKGERPLLYAQARREGVSVAEMIRRAILARCGLDAMPDTSTDLYKKVIDADTEQKAQTAIRSLQLTEYIKPIEERPYDSVYYTLYIAGDRIKDDMQMALLDLLDAVEESPIGETERIKLTKRSMSLIKKLLSNIAEEKEYPDNE